ncbi:hypothetical protein HDU81_000801 [Chytriomyces hyalinus]|nr:hypothetical protein HDU81_000801 [Chytriomyces hyalinus]
MFGGARMPQKRRKELNKLPSHAIKTVSLIFSFAKSKQQQQCSFIKTPSSFSATCLIASYLNCYNFSYPTTSYQYTFCGNGDNATSLPFPLNAPTDPLKLPKGLKCDSTSQCFSNNNQFYSACFSDPVVSDDSSQDALSGKPKNTLPQSIPSTSSSSDSGGGGFFATLSGNPLKLTLVIFGFLLGSLCVIAVIWHCVSGGKTLGPKGISSYIKDRKSQREERHHKLILEQEEKLDEEARAHANAVRREMELLTVEAERMAQRALEKEQLKVAQEEEMDRLTQERHDMMIADMKRKDQQFEREMLMISMRSEQREEDLKTSSNYVKVLESTIVEDGRIVESRKEVQRKRYGRTDKEAQQGPDLPRIQNEQYSSCGSGANCSRICSRVGTVFDTRLVNVNI